LCQGGRTEVVVLYKGLKYKGLAHCNDIDNFNKKKGFIIALSRAFGKIGRGKLREALAES